MLEENLDREREGLPLPFKKRHLVVVSIKDDPFFMVKAPGPGKNFTGNDRFEGYCVDLMARLSEYLNVTYELRLVKDEKFGTKSNNYTFFKIIIS